MIWHLSWRADPAARPLADRHYTRQSVGARQFVPPGSCLVCIRLCALAGADSFDGSSASKFAVTLAPLDNARRQTSWVF